MDAAVTGKRGRRTRRPQGTHLELATSWHEIDMETIEAEIRQAEKLKADADAQKQKGFEGSWRQQQLSSEVKEPQTNETTNKGNYEVFVGNLPFTVTENNISSLFSDVRSVSILRNNDGKPRGSAIVSFGSKKAHDEAVEQNQIAAISGRSLKIESKSGTSDFNRPKQPFSRDIFSKASTSEPRRDLDWGDSRGSAIQPDTDSFFREGSGRDLLRDVLGSITQPQLSSSDTSAPEKTWSRTSFGSGTHQKEALKVPSSEVLTREIFGQADVSVQSVFKSKVTENKEFIGRELFGSLEPTKPKADELNVKKNKNYFIGSARSDGKASGLVTIEGSWRESKPAEQPTTPVIVFKEESEAIKKDATSQKKRVSTQDTLQITKGKPFLKETGTFQLGTKVDITSVSWRESEPLPQPDPPRIPTKVEVLKNSDSIPNDTKSVHNANVKTSEKNKERPISAEVSVTSGNTSLKKVEQQQQVTTKKKDKDPFGWNTVGNCGTKEKKVFSEPTQQKRVPKKIITKSMNPFDALKN